MIKQDLAGSITIAIPVRERTEFFRQALESARNQSVRTKILVMDNASSHGQFRSIVDRLDDPLVEYRRHKQLLGMEENWNSCLEAASTEWISILHDDDLLYPGYIESVCNVLAREPGVGCVAVRCSGGAELPKNMTDAGAHGNYHPINWQHFLWENLSPFPGVMFRREDGLRLGGFRPEWHPSADMEFWIRLAESTKTILIEQELAFYRISVNQGSRVLAGDIIDKTYEIRRNLLERKHHLNWITNYLVHESTRGTLEFYRSVYGREFDTGRYDSERYSWLRRWPGMRAIARWYRSIFLNS